MTSDKFHFFWINYKLIVSIYKVEICLQLNSVSKSKIEKKTTVSIYCRLRSNNKKEMVVKLIVTYEWVIEISAKILMLEFLIIFVSLNSLLLCSCSWGYAGKLRDLEIRISTRYPNKQVEVIGQQTSKPSGAFEVQIEGGKLIWSKKETFTFPMYPRDMNRIYYYIDEALNSQQQ